MAGAPTIAAFGDSLFEGWGLRAAKAAPVRLERLLAGRIPGSRVLNFGVSGETAEEGLRRIDSVVRAHPDLVLVEFGANDFYQLVDPARMERALAAIIETLQAAGCGVFLVGIRCLAEFTGEDYKARFAPVFPRLEQRFEVPLFPDIFSAYLHDPALVLADGIHPNEAGASAIAAALLPGVLDALGQSA